MHKYGIHFIGRDINNTWLYHDEGGICSSDHALDSTKKILAEITDNHPGKPYIVRGAMMGLIDQANHTMHIRGIGDKVITLAVKLISDAVQLDPKLQIDVIWVKPKIPSFFFTEAGISSGESIWSVIPQALVMLYNGFVYIFEEPEDFNSNIEKICSEISDPEEAKSLLKAFLKRQVDLTLNTAEFWGKKLS